MSESVAMRASPAPALEAAYRHAHATRMAGLPFLNDRLAVEAVGFAPWKAHWLGVVVTPWFMNLVVAPREAAQWRSLPAGEKRRFRFPAGEYDFVSAREEGVGEFFCCSLFSPVGEFEDQATARFVAEHALAALLDPANDERAKPADAPGVVEAEPVPVLSRRDLLRGRFQPDRDERAGPPQARIAPQRVSAEGSPASLEGELAVRLDWDGRRVRRTTVRSSRPLAVPRVLAGRDVREAAAMVPRLYSVCANAQGAAATCALEVACGRDVPTGLLQARTLAVALEALQEDLRRLLIDLPAAAGVPGAVGTVAEARKAIAPMLAALRDVAAFDADGPAIATDRIRALGEQLRTLVDTDVLGMRADAFVAFGEAQQFVAWSQRSPAAPALVVRHVLHSAPRLGASDIRTMPKPTPATIAAAVLKAVESDADFSRAPHWAGEVVETGAFARCRDHPGLLAFVGAQGNGVAARLLARLLEVARVVVALAAGHVEPRIAAWSPNRGEGVAAVDTARGLLLHRARVVDGRVAGYAIVAPTEWNFHPDGALARGLSGLVADDEQALVRAANLVVQALDPCVACRVEVARA